MLLHNFLLEKEKEGIYIPESGAPYKRGYKHTKDRGKEETVSCSLCGTVVPRWKCITQKRGFRITDPLLKKMLGKNRIHTLKKKEYICPKCARFHGIVRRRGR